MPNWCSGDIVVKGKPEAVKKFCKYFVFEEQNDCSNTKAIQKEYFARSFAETSWDDFKKEHLKDSPSEISFLVSFAWSCHSCMVEGYPNGKQLVTLKDVCKKLGVEVWIETEETGLGFEEDIHCNKGELSDSCEDMVSYECKGCENKQYLSTQSEVSDLECGECEDPKFEVVKN